MSLIEIRRERKRDSIGPNRPPRLWKLVAALLLVGFMIWYLHRLV
jgi:hypothetical protein